MFETEFLPHNKPLNNQIELFNVIFKMDFLKKMLIAYQISNNLAKAQFHFYVGFAKNFILIFGTLKIFHSVRKLWKS